jgi:mono/diheme cytochrome c family protein
MNRRNRNSAVTSIVIDRGWKLRAHQPPLRAGRTINLRHKERVIKKCLYARTLLVVFVLASCLPGQTVGTQEVPVTVVRGESWLRHLHRPFNETSMGKTWDLGPPPPLPGQESLQWQVALSPSSPTNAITLHGSDLYRLNCQGCHGELGLGTPPEINSVINPVRATSVAVIMERGKKTGQNLGRADATVLAKQAKDLLMERFHKGGENMPPFPYLSNAEIRSIVAYLEQLSEVPGAERNQLAVRESHGRRGEQIVKSTCHICHSAAGPNPDPQELLQGAIPPLSTLTMRTSLPDFVRKVTYGAPIVMGTLPMSDRETYRGRMPVFLYLSQEEAADAYMYLMLYPPHP